MNDLAGSPATDVLLDEGASHDAATWLVPGGEAALALGLAADHPAATIHWLPVDLLERNRAQPSPDNLRTHEPGTMIAGVDAVVIAAPPDRALARRQLLVARSTLRTGGHLYLAGANAEGVKSVISDAGHLFGPPRSGSYRSKQRVALFRPGDVPSIVPSWATAAGVAPGTWEPFVLDLGDGAVPLVTQAGVFAGARVDAGTRLLLDALPERIDGRVLDAGCGAGIIGIAAARRGAESVDMTDVNLLVVQAANENVARLALPNVRVLASDIYDAAGGARYDLIASNPPFHRGKAVDFTMADRLIAEAPVYLTSGGSLLLVANAFLAYGKRMARVFGHVETLIATRQFHVIRATDPR